MSAPVNPLEARARRALVAFLAATAATLPHPIDPTGRFHDHHWRQTQATVPLTGNEVDQSLSPEDALIEAEEHAQGMADVVFALKGLSPELRQVVELRFFEGLSQREVGVRLGKAERTIRKYEAVALAKLREALKDERNENG